MKRGFLNVAHPKKSAVVSPKTTQCSKPEPEVKVTIPTSPIALGEVPHAGTLPDLPCYVVTSLSSSSHFPSTNATAAVLYSGMKEKILALPAFSTPLPFSAHLRHYRINPIDGTGVGMFATKDFNPGDLIACDRPLLVAPACMVFTPSSTHPRDILDMTINRMSAVDRAAYLALSNCKGPSQSLSMGILETNGLGVGALPGYNGQCTSVCKDISRINHSCSPNAYARWNLDLFNYECRALRPIRANEQITISYLSDDLLPRSERRKELQEKYTFKCTCDSCILPKKESLRSDTRRAILASRKIPDPFDETELNAWVLDATASDNQLVTHDEKLMGIMEEEGCYHTEVWPARVQRLVKSYCALENKDAVRKWAEKAAILTCVFTGDDKGWMKVAAHPEKTTWWGRRMKVQKEMTFK